MRKVLIAAGIFVLCLPMLFVGWILAAAQWPRMDATTKQAPPALRQAIAGMVLDKAGWGKRSLPALDRALRIDPENGNAWERRCGVSFMEKSTPNLKDCETAVTFGKKANDYYNLGRAQDSLGDWCNAEESYTQASSLSSSSQYYPYVEGMGRAALRCGHWPASRAGLELALQLEQTSLGDTDNDEDEIADTKKDMLEDREYLLITYHRMHEDTLAGQTCTAAHEGWKACSCDLDAKGVVACHEVR